MAGSSAAKPPASTNKRIMPIIAIRPRAVLMMPQIIPPLVVLSPSGSICPVFIFSKSFLPMIHAGIPVKRPHKVKPNIPRTKIKVPR